MPSVECAGLRPGACLLAEKLKLPRQREAGAAAVPKKTPANAVACMAFCPLLTQSGQEPASNMQLVKWQSLLLPHRAPNLREHAV